MALDRPDIQKSAYREQNDIRIVVYGWKKAKKNCMLLSALANANEREREEEKRETNSAMNKHCHQKACVFMNHNLCPAKLNEPCSGQCIIKYTFFHTHIHTQFTFLFTCTQSSNSHIENLLIFPKRSRKKFRPKKRNKN